LNEKCDENTVNLHMLRCYQEHIDSNIDATSAENAYYMEGSLLCQFVFLLFVVIHLTSVVLLIKKRAYNESASYRHCLFSIFDVNDICSFDRYPFSYEYSKIYWKLVMSSCSVDKSKLLLLFNIDKSNRLKMNFR